MSQRRIQRQSAPCRGIRPGLARGLGALGLTLCCALSPCAATWGPDASGAREEAREGTETAPIDGGLVEVLEIEGRLGAAAPPPVTSATADVLTRDDIRSQQPRSVAELIAPLANVNAIDEIGNGRQMALELRGFAGSAGATAVTLDGLRINEPDTNTMAWELVRLEDLERVEVQAGPRAALGGGSLAGVVHISRRRAPGVATRDVSLTFGGHGLADARAFGGTRLGRLRLGASGSHVRDAGFRDGADIDERAGRLALGMEAGSVALDLDWSHVEGRWRQPGALTEDEMRRNRRDSTYNALDAQEQSQDLVTLRAERAAGGDDPKGGRTSWIAVAGFRDRQSATLTTGRSCYGFMTDDSVQSLSTAFEASSRLDAAGRARLRWGAELQRDRLHPEGHATDDACDGEVHAEALASAMDLDWDRAAVFASIEKELPGSIVLDAGLRHDRSGVSRVGEELADSGLLEPRAGSARFSGTQGHVGFARAIAMPEFLATLRARWEQSSLAPSATQLFAYPGYFSNPSLGVQRGQGPAAGVEFSATSWSALAEIFQTSVEDEIVYDDAARKNMNAGSTRRRGARMRARWHPHARILLSLDVVVSDATFRSGWGSDAAAIAGARVPLVPRHDATLGLDFGPWRDTTMRLALRSIGDAALSDDFDGSSPPLPAHEVLDLSARTRLPGRAGLELTLSLTNALDERHATRGIEAEGGPYFTPAAPRAIAFGIHHRH